MTSIEITNYQILGNVKIVVEGITLLTGETDNGKSAMIRACEAAIYNHSGSSFVRHGANSCSVELDLPESQGHKPFKFKWKKGTSGSGSYMIGDRELKKTGRSSVPEITEQGFGEVVVLDSKVRFNFWKQLEEPFLVFQSPSKIFDLISKVQEERVLVPILDDMAVDETQIKEDAKEAETRMVFLKAEVGKDERILEALTSLPDMLIVLAETEQAELKRVAIIEAIRSHGALKKEVSQLQLNIEGVDKVLEDLQSGLHLVAEAEVERVSAEAYYEDFSSIAAKIGIVEALPRSRILEVDLSMGLVEEMLAQAVLMRESVDTIKRIEGELHSVQGTINRDEGSLRILQKELEKSKESVCPECGRPY